MNQTPKQVVGECIVYFVTIDCEQSYTFECGLYSTHYLAHFLLLGTFSYHPES